MDEFYEEEIEELRKTLKTKAIIIAGSRFNNDFLLIGITLDKMDSGNIGKSRF